MFFHNGVFRNLTQVLDFYVDRDIHPDRFYPRDAAGHVVKYDDIPPQYRANVDTVDAPFDRHPGDPPALTPAEIQDIIAFLDTLTITPIRPDEGGSPAGAVADFAGSAVFTVRWMDTPNEDLRTFGAAAAALLVTLPQAHATTAITAGNARFEFLTPSLVRMEYSPQARFVDAPTAVVQKRDWPAVAVTEDHSGGWLISPPRRCCCATGWIPARSPPPTSR